MRTPRGAVVLRRFVVAGFWFAAIVSITNPVSSEITQGQDNGLVLLLLVVSMVRMPRLDSGVFMGMALAVKPVTGLILLVPLLRREPRITLVAVATLAVVNLAFVPLI